MQVTQLSGSWTDLETDDQSYMVFECDTANQRYWVDLTADSSYTPSEVTKITIEYQVKRSRSDTPDPDSCIIWVRKADGSWYDLGYWLPGTTDTLYTWETTDVSTYMGSNGELGFRQCACPVNSNDYTMSINVMRFRLELAP